MTRFLRDESGYAMVLTLIFLPVFLGMALLVMDIGRGNNAHSDLSAAADALALAGARELDGGADAIDRAKAAMTELTNTVSYLDFSGASAQDLVYADTEGNEFRVVFLTDIPDGDDEPIDNAFLEDNDTTDGTLAQYVWVGARAQDLLTFFFNPTTRARETVPIGASAVATYSSAACDVTPLYICNPFESSGIDLQDAFAAGQLHGRLIKLHPKGSDTASPGNFGFLQVTGKNDNTSASADAIRDIFAGDYNPTCYDARLVETKPGAATSIAQGLNVRFDIYSGPYSNAAGTYPPAENVRKGYVRSGSGQGQGGNPCNTELTTNTAWAMPFPPNSTMAPPGSGAAGAFVGSGDWDIDTYWQVNFGSTPTPEMLAEMNSMPEAVAPGATVPSRYDVYRYEIANDLVDNLSAGDGTGAKRESGLPVCAASKNPPIAPQAEPDRRVIFAAIIDCLANESQGGGVNEYPVNSYASLFLVGPMQTVGGGGDGTIDVEITDITGYGGNGTLDLFVRTESELVR